LKKEEELLKIPCLPNPELEPEFGGRHRIAESVKHPKR
jgi:hypothetical protein